MAFVVNDRVQENTNSIGTGTIDLDGAVIGFESFISAIGNGNTTYYTIAFPDQSEFEVGVGTVTSGSPNTLSRDSVISSSNGDALVNFSAGVKTVICTLPASKAILINNSNDVIFFHASAVLTGGGNYFSNYNAVVADKTTTVDSSQNAILYGPITVNSGFTWTIASGSELRIV